MSDQEPRADEVSIGRRVSVAIEFIVKVVAIGVPILYALGRIYSDSYWQELHLPSSLMGYSAEDYLYFGFTSLVSGLARLVGVEPYTTMAYAALAALVAAAMTILAAFLDTWMGRVLKKYATKFEQKIGEWKQSKHGKLVRHVVFGAAIGTGSFVVMMFLVALSLCVFLPIVFAATEGKRQASIERDRLTQPQPKQGQPALSPLVYYESRGTRASARLMECSDSWCVVFSQEAFVAIPRSDVYRVDQGWEPRQAGH